MLAPGPDTPKQVLVANTAAMEAVAADEQAAAEFRAARADVQAAGAIDRSRDREALAAGREMPTERVEVEAQRAVTFAARRAEAARGIADEAVLELARQINAARPEWQPRADAAAADIRGEILNLCDRIDEAFVSLATAEAVARALGEWVGQGVLLEDFNAPQRLDSHTVELRALLAPELGQNRLVSGSITLD